MTPEASGPTGNTSWSVHTRQTLNQPDQIAITLCAGAAPQDAGSRRRGQRSAISAERGSAATRDLQATLASGMQTPHGPLLLTGRGSRKRSRWPLSLRCRRYQGRLRCLLRSYSGATAPADMTLLPPIALSATPSARRRRGSQATCGTGTARAGQSRTAAARLNLCATSRRTLCRSLSQRLCGRRCCARKASAGRRLRRIFHWDGLRTVANHDPCSMLRG